MRPLYFCSGSEERRHDIVFSCALTRRELIVNQIGVIAIDCSGASFDPFFGLADAHLKAIRHPGRQSVAQSEVIALLHGRRRHDPLANRDRVLPGNWNKRRLWKKFWHKDDRLNVRFDPCSTVALSRQIRHCGDELGSTVKLLYVERRPVASMTNITRIAELQENPNNASACFSSFGKWSGTAVALLFIGRSADACMNSGLTELNKWTESTHCLPACAHH